MAGRGSQGQAAGVADQSGRNGDDAPPQGGDHGLAAVDAVAGRDAGAIVGEDAGELVQPGGDVGRGLAPAQWTRDLWLRSFWQRSGREAPFIVGRAEVSAV